MQCTPVGVRPTVPRLLIEEPEPPGPPELRDEFRSGPDPYPRPTDWGSTRKEPTEPAGPREQRALDREKEQQDRLLARQIYARMRVERELWQARMAAMMADLQTEIQRIWQEVMLRRRKTQDEMLENWHKVMFR